MKIKPTFDGAKRFKARHSLSALALLGAISCHPVLMANAADTPNEHQIYQTSVTKGCEDVRDYDNLYAPKEPPSWIKMSEQDLRALQIRMRGYEHGRHAAHQQRMETGAVSCGNTETISQDSRNALAELAN